MDNNRRARRNEQLAARKAEKKAEKKARQGGSSNIEGGESSNAEGYKIVLKIILSEWEKWKAANNI